MEMCFNAYALMYFLKRAEHGGQIELVMNWEVIPGEAMQRRVSFRRLRELFITSANARKLSVSGNNLVRNSWSLELKSCDCAFGFEW
jgi:hypothetical protein